MALPTQTLNAAFAAQQAALRSTASAAAAAGGGAAATSGALASIGKFLANPYVALAVLAVQLFVGAKQRKAAKVEAERAASFSVTLTGDGSGKPIPRLAGRFRTRGIPTFSDSAYSLIARPTQNVIGSMSDANASNNGKYHIWLSEFVLGVGAVDRVTEVWATNKRVCSSDLLGEFIAEWITDGHEPWMSVASQLTARPAGADVPTGYALVPDDGDDRIGKPASSMRQVRNNPTYPWTVVSTAFYYSLRDPSIRPPFELDAFGIGERQRVVDEAAGVYTLPATPVATSDPLAWWMGIALANGVAEADFDLASWHMASARNVAFASLDSKHVPARVRQSVSDLGGATTYFDARVAKFDEFIERQRAWEDGGRVGDPPDNSEIAAELASANAVIGASPTNLPTFDTLAKMIAYRTAMQEGRRPAINPVYSCSEPLSSILASGLQDGIKRWECNGVIDTSQDLPTQLDTIASCIPGLHIWRRNGKYMAKIPDWETAADAQSEVTFEDADLLAPTTINTPDVMEKPVRVVARYANALKNGASDSLTWPAQTSALANNLNAEDRGRGTPLSDELALCDNPFHAADRAGTGLFLARRRTFELHLTLVGVALEPGDVVSVTDTVMGLTDQRVEVMDYPQIEGEFAMVRVFCREFVQDDYAPKIGRPVVWKPATWDDLTVLPPTAVTAAYDAAQRAFTVHWEHADGQMPDAVWYEVEHQLITSSNADEGPDEGAWEASATVPVDVAKHVRFVEAGERTRHAFRVRTKGRFGNVSGWVNSNELVVVTPSHRYGQIPVGTCPPQDVGVETDLFTSTIAPQRTWRKGKGALLDAVGTNGIALRTTSAATFVGGGALSRNSLEAGDRFTWTSGAVASALIPSEFITGGGTAYLRVIAFLADDDGGSGTGMIQLSAGSEAPSAAGPELTDDAERALRFVVQKDDETPLVIRLDPRRDATEPYAWRLSSRDRAGFPNSINDWLRGVGFASPSDLTVTVVDSSKRCGGVLAEGLDYAEVLGPWVPEAEFLTATTLFAEIAEGGCPDANTGVTGAITLATNAPLRQWQKGLGWEAAAIGSEGVLGRGSGVSTGGTSGTFAAGNFATNIFLSSAQRPVFPDAYYDGAVPRTDGVVRQITMQWNGKWWFDNRLELTASGIANTRIVLQAPDGTTRFTLTPNVTGRRFQVPADDLAAYQTLLRAMPPNGGAWAGGIVATLDQSQRCAGDLLNPWIPRIAFTGGDGLGLEHIFALTASETLAASQRPDNDWGYDQPGTVGDLTWHDAGAGLVASSAMPWLHEWVREVAGTPAPGTAIANQWRPHLVTRAFGLTGDSGNSFRELALFQSAAIAASAPTVPASATVNLSTLATTGLGSWSTGRPIFNPTSHQLWQTIAVANAQDAVNDVFSFQASDWSTPVVTDGSGDLEVVYRRYDRTPTNADTPPAGSAYPPSGWHDTPEQVPADNGLIYQVVGHRVSRQASWTWAGPPLRYEGADSIRIETDNDVALFLNVSDDSTHLNNWRPRHQRATAKWVENDATVLEFLVDFTMVDTLGGTAQFPVGIPVPSLVIGAAAQMERLSGYQNTNPNLAPLDDNGVSTTFLGVAYRLGGTGAWTRVTFTGTQRRMATIGTAPTGGNRDRQVHVDATTFGDNPRCVFVDYLGARACLRGRSEAYEIGGAEALLLEGVTGGYTWRVGTAVTGAVVARNGTGSYTYSVTSGGLPAGVGINASTGAFTGTPTIAGSGTARLRVVDTAGNDAVVTIAWTVETDQSVLPLALQSTTVTITAGVTDSVTLPVAQGGVLADPVAYSLTGLPAWASFVQSTRVLTTAPPLNFHTGIYRLTYEASQANGGYARTNINLIVNNPAQGPQPVTNLVATAISGTITASWTAGVGATSYAWAIARKVGQGTGALHLLARGTTTTTSISHSGLEVGNQYQVSVTSVRGDETSAIRHVSVTMTA